MHSINDTPTVDVMGPMNRYVILLRKIGLEAQSTAEAAPEWGAASSSMPDSALGAVPAQRGWTTIAEPPPRRTVSAAASNTPPPRLRIAVTAPISLGVPAEASV